MPCRTHDALPIRCSRTILYMHCAIPTDRKQHAPLKCICPTIAFLLAASGCFALLGYRIPPSEWELKPLEIFRSLPGD